MLEIVGDRVGERREAPERTRKRPGRYGTALVGRGGETIDALEKRACLFARKAVHARIDVSLIDRDQVHRLLVASCACLAEEPPRVCNDRRPILFIIRQAVQHDDERKTALPHAAQHLPRHQVGVAGRRGDEDAQIAGLNQQVGELAIVTVDRVDVRRIDDGHPVSACGRRRQLQPVFRDARRDDRSRQFDPYRSALA